VLRRVRQAAACRQPGPKRTCCHEQRANLCKPAAALHKHCRFAAQRDRSDRESPADRCPCQRVKRPPSNPTVHPVQARTCL